MKLFRTIIVAIGFLIAAHSVPAQASQGSCVMPTTGTVSGLTLVQDINTCLQAAYSSNSGGTAPTNLGPYYGGWWLDTSTNFLKMYDGASWLPLVYLDTTNHIASLQIGGGTATIASATTTDLCSVPQNALTISGTTTITSLSNTCVAGSMKTLVFSGVLTLTHNATSLILPNGGSNITTAAGDSAWAEYLGGGNWRIISYTRADGTALNASANFTGAVFFNSVVSPTALSGNTDNWNPSGLLTLNTIRFSCSGAINITGLTAPATDGKVVVLDNIGATNTCTLTSEDSSSTAGNRFSLTRPYPIRPATQVALRYDLTTARWKLLQDIAPQMIAGSYRALIVTNVALTQLSITAPATPTRQMKIIADAITVEDSKGNAFRLSSVSVTPSLSSSGANGLDTGTVGTSSWYYSYVIYNPSSGGTVAGLWSLQSSCGSVTMPSGYTGCARVGANFVDGSSNLRTVVQYGRRTQYVVGTSALAALPAICAPCSGTPSTTGPTYAANSISNYVPPTASHIAIVISLGAAVTNGLVAPNSSYSGYATGNPPPVVNASSASSQGSAPAWMAIESTDIYTAGGGIVAVFGWEDNL